MPPGVPAAALGGAPIGSVTAKGSGLGKVVAFLAECQGSATIDEQRASLAPGDHVVVAGKKSLNKLADLLAQHGIRLGAGDRVKIYDLSCISLSTTTVVRLMSRLLRGGVSFEIISAGIVIRPDADDKLHALLAALEGHYRFLRGIKTHPADRRGRRFILGPEQLPEIRARLDKPGATATGVAKDLGVARSTLFNFLDRHDRERQFVRSQKGKDGDIKGAGDPAHVGKRKAGIASS